MLAVSDTGGPVAMTAIERLKLNGLSQEYIQEVMGPQVKRQTGQDIEDLSDLALSMALDREDQGLQVFGIGGWLGTVLDELAVRSKAELKFNTKVSGLREMVDEGIEGWILQYADIERESDREL